MELKSAPRSLASYQTDVRAVDVLHVDVALPLKGWLEEERDDEDEADDRCDDQRLQGGPRRVDELPGDHVKHRLVGGSVAVPIKCKCRRLIKANGFLRSS